MEKVSGVGTLTRPSRDPTSGSGGGGGGGGYNYETYHFSNSTTSRSASSTNKIQATPPPVEQNTPCCSFQCCKRFTRGFCSNIGVCLLLLAYTLLGSFIFLAIEGGNNNTETHVNNLEPTEKSIALSPQQNQNVTAWLRRANTASRARAVENIWDITVSLNILYRENWTRLAAEELARFQVNIYLIFMSCLKICFM